MPILHWLTRSADIEAASQVQYRVLEEVDSLHYGDKNSDNLLIQGDNLDALKALLPYYAGQVKCIYIDPPYNTGHAFEHYDDNVEHSQWLSLMYARLELLWQFLQEGGSIWIQIDDDEFAYMKVICDELFGRKSFIASSIWQKRTSPDARLNLGAAHEYILVYGKNAQFTRDNFNLLTATSKTLSQYKNPDNDPRGPWASTDFTGQAGHATPDQFFTIISPTGKKHTPPPGRCWALAPRTFEQLQNEGRVWFGKDGNAKPRLKRYLTEAGGVAAWTWWTNQEVGHYQESKKEIITLFGEAIFDTPKPERLIERIIHIASNPGDLVMDTFLGSGTTAAVAHKMGRRYIGVEMGEHCVTHCQPRLVKVVDGEQGGISKSQNWQGGGGFRFYRLGAPLFNEEGLISREVTFKNLSAHIWFSETYSPIATGRTDTSAILGVHDDVAYVVLHPESSSTEVLTSVVLRKLKDELELQGYSEVKKIVVYGESCRMGDDRLREQGVVFKQIPYDVKAR
ncbi:MAG: site-specific DNA-methyltransferase [Akkermansia sp.]|nr:site-specific DNA-methyltransferase [Akkermansia sp.]